MPSIATGTPQQDTAPASGELPAAVVDGSAVAGTTTQEAAAATSSSATGSASTTASTTTAAAIGTTTLTSSGTSTPPQVTSHVNSASGAATTTATSTESAAPSGADSKGSSEIESGRAVATANILNILNANMVNSEGRLILSNFFDTYDGTLDFRPAGSAGICSIFSCEGVEGIDVRLLSGAHIENALLLSAMTGGNSIEGGNDASIDTGDAYAGLNLVNIANANFIDSRYLLISMNAFQDVNGDIVFPNLSSFMGSSGTGLSASDVSSRADVENELDIQTGTGDNAADSASSTIQTGSAHSSSNVFNQLNSTLSGGHNVMILLRVHGDWVGEVFGAPDELSRSQGLDSSLFTMSGASSHIDGFASTTASSTASIKNRLSLSAFTGKNSIAGAASALITTGDAYAGANLVNIANANVIGRNWVLAILNIFGNFRGNLSFGRPDLWVGEQAVLGPASPAGREIEYKISVINNGDARATAVRLSDSFDADRLAATWSSDEHTLGDRSISWDLGTIPPGGAKEVSYRARMKQAASGIKLKNSVSVSGHESDNNNMDNDDAIEVEIPVPPMSWGSLIPPNGDASPDDQAAASTSATSSAPLDGIMFYRSTPGIALERGNRKAAERIIIKNTHSRAVRSVSLSDMLVDPAGGKLKEESWKIGDMKPHEQITLSYEIEFQDQAQPGIYTLSTVIEGNGTSSRSFPMSGAIELGALRAEPTKAKPPSRLGARSRTRAATVARHIPAASIAVTLDRPMPSRVVLPSFMIESDIQSPISMAR